MLYKWNSPAMHRCVAVLLILCWVVLSAIDILEDLGHSDQLELHNALAASRFWNGQPGGLVNDIVESADHSRVRRPKLLPPWPLELSIGFPAACQKSFSIHKRHRIFLI
jgi:hypothetical protein